MLWLASADRSAGERDAAVACLAAMHSEGVVDVLDHLRRPDGLKDWQLDYGAWCAVYRALLPQIDDPPRRVVEVVKELAVGIWDPALSDAFVEWCARKADRIDGVLDLHGDVGIPMFALAGALIAGMRSNPSAYIATAIAYVRSSGRLRMPGTRGMACMATGEAKAVSLAIGTLGEFVLDDLQPIGDRTQALCAMFEIAHRCGGYADAEMAMIAGQAICTGQPEFHRECCLAVVRFGRKIGNALLAVLLGAVGHLDVSQSETRSLADTALYGLFSGGLEREALPQLESILRNELGKAPFAGLKSTEHLVAHNLALLARVVSRWLLTGEKVLCAAARHLVVANGDQRLAFDFDPGNAEWPAGMTTYAARKAIGWLMPHATAPASYILCLLPEATDPEASVLLGLLSDPILVNYPVAARAYLEGACAGLPEPSKFLVSRVLAEHDAYVSGIEAVGYLPELQPTEHQRWIEQQRQNAAWAKSSAEAESQSELAALFGRQTLLYGVTAICYVDDPNGSTRRLENRLGTVSYTSDNAMGWIYDSCELDYLLRFFRAERSPG